MVLLLLHQNVCAAKLADSVHSFSEACLHAELVASVRPGSVRDFKAAKLLSLMFYTTLMQH